MVSYFANLKIESGREIPSFRAFAQAYDYSHTIRVDNQSEAPAQTGRVLWARNDIICLALENGWRYDSAEADLPVSLTVSGDHTHMSIWMPPSGQEQRQEEKLLHLLRTAIETVFPLYGTISLHASCVAVDAGAVAFTAASGTGKSVRADQWVKRLGAVQISGDRPAIHLTDQGALACGVPWDGKEQLYVSIQSPLRAICEVRRAPFQRIRRLSRMQARRLLTQQCLLPMWDPEASFAAFRVIETLIDRVPVCRMFGGPDGGLATYAHEILFNPAHSTMIEEAQPEMNIKSGYVLRNVVGESIVMPVGKNIQTFDGVLVLNDVSAFIWESLQKPIGKEDLLQLILDEFDIDAAVAASDLDAFLDKLRAHDLLEETQG